MAQGCDRTAELASRDASESASGVQLVDSKRTPRVSIEECIQAYRRITSYQDDAYVLLRYQLDGKPTMDRAPLSIAWDQSGKLGLQVYSVTAGPVDGRWRMRIGPNDLVPPNQVLSRALPGKLNFAWLLSDAIVSQSLSAGVAGFPPQLDLLLSDAPMSGLIDQTAKLAFAPQASVDGRACHVIAITQGTSEYKLVIDQATMLLRRIQLPKLNLPSEMLADQRVSDAQLTIEFENARTGGLVDWTRFRVQTQPDDLFVNHFVPAPLEFETAGLAERIPGFHLSDASGREVYSTAQGPIRRKASVLMWLADHPACRVAAEQLAEAARAAESNGLLQHGVVEFIPIWAEPTAPAGETFESLARAWNLPGSLALDREAMGRDLFKISEAPTLIVLDANNRVQLRESRANPLLGQVLPELLSKLAAGENLAAEILREADMAHARYQTELRLATAVDARTTPSVSPKSYPPLVAELTQLGKSANPSQAIAATVDASYLLWTLHADGKLVQAEFGGDQPKERAVFSTPWTASNSSRLLVSPAGNYVASWAPGVSRIDIFDTTSKQNRSVELARGATPIDMQWLTLNGTTSPRLALITEDSQSVLLDPQNREQLSGRCPAPPMAIVSRPGLDSSIDGFVVLRDQSVESLRLSEDSAHHRVPLLGQPAAFTSSKSQSEVAASMPARVSFQPAQGPWSAWTNGQMQSVLANGWLEQDEPALFLLDKDLNPRWHYRVALQSEGTGKSQAAVASDPSTSQPVWVVADAEQAVHLLRGDGLTDHFRFEDRFVSLALLPSGERLILAVVQANNTLFYDLKWR